MIDPKTGLEITPKPTYTDAVQQPTDIKGNVDTSMPTGAKSFSSSVTPVKVNIGGTQPTTDSLNTSQVTANG